MRHEVYFHEPRLVFIPVGKGANRDVLFEQGAWLGFAQAMRLVEACMCKTTIYTGTADMQQ
jgi:hypothetical protein